MSERTYLKEGIREKDLIYAAGFFDGEGTVKIEKGDRRTKKPYGFRLHIQVSNTHKGVIDWFKETFGAGYVYVRGNKTDGGRDYYDWGLYGHKAQRFLKLLYPYLKVKREDAEIGILFQESINKYGHKKEVPAYELEYRQKLRERLQNLPHRKKQIKLEKICQENTNTKR
jgi:hypothetical protein